MFGLNIQECLHYGVVIATLVFLEGLLSADNAIVLALIVRRLPDAQRGKALRYGIFGAFIFRAIGVALAGPLIKFWYFKAVGAAYLFYLAGMHFWRRWRKRGAAEDQGPQRAQISFWKTVVIVELADVAFSMDSLIAAVALIDNLFIVYLGGVLGIIAMRFMAQAFVKLLDKYPGLETSAYLLIAWVAFKLSVEIISPPGLKVWLFWSVMAVLFCGGFFFKPRGSQVRSQ